MVLYIHGCAFILGDGKWYRSNAISQVGYFRFSTCHCEDRCTPAHPYPAALDDAEEAWNSLANSRSAKPEYIILSGDSGGYTLAMALANHLKEKDRRCQNC